MAALTLTAAETHRWFQLTKHDRWYREQCRMTGVQLARVLQVSERQGQNLIEGVMNVVPAGGFQKGRGITAKMLVKVEALINNVESGRLVFWRGGHAWVTPPTTHGFAQRSIVASESWDYWRECSTCGSRKWLPIWMNGGSVERDQAYVACYQCQPPSQWRSFGARGREEILAARVVPEILLDHEPAKYARNRAVRETGDARTQ